jgi:hypothetical protein
MSVRRFTRSGPESSYVRKRSVTEPRSSVSRDALRAGIPYSSTRQVGAALRTSFRTADRRSCGGGPRLWWRDDWSGYLTCGALAPRGFGQQPACGRIGGQRRARFQLLLGDGHCRSGKRQQDCAIDRACRFGRRCLLHGTRREWLAVTNARELARYIVPRRAGDRSGGIGRQCLKCRCHLVCIVLGRRYFPRSAVLLDPRPLGYWSERARERRSTGCRGDVDVPVQRPQSRVLRPSSADLAAAVTYGIGAALGTTLS